jgi:site-specific DNA recombinase
MKQTESTKPKYFIYARKSTERDERQAHSIPDQLDTVRRLAEQHGLEVVDEFTESRTARKPGRPVFQEMLGRIEAGEANAVLAWTPDRLARNALDGGSILQLLDSGILQTLSFANFSFENTSSGKFNLGMAFVQSKYYTDSLSDVVKRGMLSKANRGLYPSGAKLGYIVEPRTKELLPDPKTHQLITQLFELYATGDYALAKLSDVMFRKGLANRSGNPLVKAQLVDILNDPLYYGAFIWGGEVYSGIHKPAVSKKLWDAAQQVYRQRSRPHSRKTEQHVFNNFMRCGICGCAITGEEHTRLQKNGNLNRWQYYRCTKKGHQQKCSQPYIRQVDLLSEFESIIRQVALPEDWVVSMLEQIDSWSVSETSRASAQLTELDLGLRKIEAKLRKLTDLMLEGDLDRADYRSRKAALIGEKAAKYEARKLIASKGAKYWLEPLRELVNAVWERNLPTAGGDLLKLRDFVAEVGSNWVLDSRKVLWDWVPPYALLAERASSLNWSGRPDSNWRPPAPKAGALTGLRYCPTGR